MQSSSPTVAERLAFFRNTVSGAVSEGRGSGGINSTPRDLKRVTSSVNVRSRAMRLEEEEKKKRSSVKKDMADGGDVSNDDGGKPEVYRWTLRGKGKSKRSSKASGAAGGRGGRKTLALDGDNPKVRQSCPDSGSSSGNASAEGWAEVAVSDSPMPPPTPVMVDQEEETRNSGGEWGGEKRTAAGSGNSAEVGDGGDARPASGGSGEGRTEKVDEALSRARSGSLKRRNKKSEKKNEVEDEQTVVGGKEDGDGEESEAKEEKVDVLGVFGGVRLFAFVEHPFVKGTPVNVDSCLGLFVTKYILKTHD